LQAYLSRLLETHDFEIVSAGPLNEQFIGSLELTAHDTLIIDWHEDNHGLTTSLLDTLTHWDRPVLFNDTTATEISLRQGNPDFGRMLAEQINALLADRPEGNRSADTT
jgi:hypothetical protein